MNASQLHKLFDRCFMQNGIVRQNIIQVRNNGHVSKQNLKGTKQLSITVMPFQDITSPHQQSSQALAC